MSEPIRKYFQARFGNEKNIQPRLKGRVEDRSILPNGENMKIIPVVMNIIVVERKSAEKSI